MHRSRQAGVAQKIRTKIKRGGTDWKEEERRRLITEEH